RRPDSNQIAIATAKGALPRNLDAGVSHDRGIGPFKNSPFIRLALPAVRAWRRSSSVCLDSGLLRNRNNSILAKTSAVMTESLHTAHGQCATSPPHAYPCTGPGGERFSLRSEGRSQLNDRARLCS